LEKYDDTDSFSQFSTFEATNFFKLNKKLEF